MMLIMRIIMIKRLMLTMIMTIMMMMIVTMMMLGMIVKISISINMMKDAFNDDYDDMMQSLC